MNGWITLDELSVEFGIAKHTLQNRISNGSAMPPSYFFGRKRLFRREEVNEWIAQTRTETTITNLGRKSRYI